MDCDMSRGAQRLSRRGLFRDTPSRPVDPSARRAFQLVDSMFLTEQPCPPPTRGPLLGHAVEHNTNLVAARRARYCISSPGVWLCLRVGPWPNSTAYRVKPASDEAPLPLPDLPAHCAGDPPRRSVENNRAWPTFPSGSTCCRRSL